MEPFRIPSPHRTPPGPPHPPPRRPPSISVGTQTEETPPAERGGAQEPPPPGSPPCPPPPAPSTSSPEPTTPESPPPTATPSPAPPGARKELRPKEPIMSPGSRRANYNLEGVSVKMFLRGRPITMYVPSGHVGFRPELPPERLQLDWVYGYRGRDSRSNLHVLGSGELIYFIACVVVLLHVPLRRQRHYLRHSDCVRCLAVHPDRLRVATGQAAGVDKDGKPLQPVVHIWDSATLLTLQQIGLGSFERGVGSLAFSCAVSPSLHLSVCPSSILLSLCPSVFLSPCPPIPGRSICLSVGPSILLSLSTSILWYLCPLVPPSLRASVPWTHHPSVLLSFCPSILLFLSLCSFHPSVLLSPVLLSLCLSVPGSPTLPSFGPSIPPHPSVPRSLCPSVPPSLHPSVPPSLHPSVPPSFGPSIPWSLCPSVLWFLRPFVPQSLHPSVPPSLSPSTPRSLCPPVPLSAPQDQGSYLCVVDDSNEHMMSVWDCARGTKLAEVKSTNESVLSVEFNPQDSSSIITSGKSHVYFWTWSGATLTKKQGIFGKYKKPKFIQCFVFDAAGDVLTGDSEGNILTWTRAGDGRGVGKGGKETYQIGQQTRAHEGSVFALCRRRDGTVLSGGGKDRRVLSWSPALSLLQEAEIPERFGAVRTIAEGPGEELLVGTTRNALLRGTLSGGFTAIVQGHTDEVWGLATHPTRCLFLTCGHDRQLCLWDGQEHALAWSLALEDTGLCADFHPGGQVVVVGLLTGRWVVLDTETQQPLAGGSDGNEQLSVVRFSPDGAFLAIGSHDNVIYIYSVTEEGRRYNRFGRCTGHSSFITHLDWSKDGHFIMSNSGDYEILYWDVAGGCKLLRNRFESRDREWASYTCVLGFHVFGVWPDGSDGTDINSLCRSHHERLVAVADDFCKVHLFQYPCARPKAPSHVYGGHGSHVTNVRFTHDDGHLVSLGGKDTGVFQWRVLGGPSPEPR
ncbi:echinoderm microtubule-associated protein-like 3 isoform X2 [Gallus gallus]|uniref:echinoderm microtubule-associated protein-like 3 isoform X2 n=1 Tax=Gallus gallus TaxID=9031 RepID=UPI001F015843|nr:echinoderm microtubule-associated protein-like 3 isoform X2 [Gallus gallus]